ncbi:MAG: isoprenylcysteine carboxylmethyltransferase family protein [Burkholderiales bacterium]
MIPTGPNTSTICERTRRALVSYLLVVIQFGALLGFALLLDTVRWSLATVVLVGLGACLGVWALAANRPGNFNIRPEPKAGATLITVGPYRYIRHPMYAALLVGCAGIGVGAGGWRSAMLYGLLAVVLLTKAALEERRLLESDAAYAQYRRSTKRFIPFVW